MIFVVMVYIHDINRKIISSTIGLEMDLKYQAAKSIPQGKISADNKPNVADGKKSNDDKKVITLFLQPQEKLSKRKNITSKNLSCFL